MYWHFVLRYVKYSKTFPVQKGTKFHKRYIFLFCFYDPTIYKRSCSVLPNIFQDSGLKKGCFSKKPIKYVNLEFCLEVEKILFKYGTCSKRFLAERCNKYCPVPVACA